jgi:hypothetical protein
MIFGTPPIVTNGLVLHLDAGSRQSYMSGSTTWSDLSENTRNMTLTVSGSAATSASFNLSNQGILTFTGSSTAHSFAFNNTPYILTGSQNFSIGVWIYPRTPPQAITSIIDFNHSQGGNGWVIQSEDSTTNRFYYLAYCQTGTTYQPAGNIGVGKGVQITNNTWQYLCYTKNNTSVIGYLNGIQKVNYTATSATVAYSASIQPLWIASVFGNSRFVNGDYGSVQIYNRGLSTQEVSQNYNALKSRFGLS